MNIRKATGNALRWQGLTGGYGKAMVIRDLSYTLRAGNVLGIIGRNGVGKTTLARLLVGSLSPRNGTIHLAEQQITAKPAWQRQRLGLGYMPQTELVFDTLSVAENLQITGYFDKAETYRMSFPILLRTDQRAGLLSGGERKIISFTRAMIEPTAVVILDEPTEGLQQENIQHMLNIIRYHKNRTFIVIEQNLEFLSQIATDILGLDVQNVVLQAPMSELSLQKMREVLLL